MNGSKVHICMYVYINIYVCIYTYRCQCTRIDTYIHIHRCVNKKSRTVQTIQLPVMTRLLQLGVVRRYPVVVQRWWESRALFDRADSQKFVAVTGFSIQVLASNSRALYCSVGKDVIMREPIDDSADILARCACTMQVAFVCQWLCWI